MCVCQYVLVCVSGVCVYGCVSACMYVGVYERVCGCGCKCVCVCQCFGSVLVGVSVCVGV